MNRTVMDYLVRKMGGEDERDYRRGVPGSGRGGRRGSRRGGRGRDSRDMRDMRDYEDDERYFEYEDDERDYRDYESDMRDYNDMPIRLTKTDMHKWKKTMKNEDGTKGEHYPLEEVEKVAEKIGVRFNEYSEKEFCIAVNMMYSDYCSVIKKYVPPDRVLHFCAELAKAFLEDEDGPEPSEKLALYFHCIVCDAV